MGILGLLLPLLLAFGGQATTPSKPVALQIYFHDGFAFPESSANLFEKMYAKLRPDLNYRRILLNTSLSSAELRRELIKELKTSLLPEEELSVLIIDTHGATQISTDGGSKTELRYLGSISEFKVDSEFEQIFNPLKMRATKNLQIILNSCSTFCGDPEISVKRGWAMLDYFGAINGSIYGSNVAEVSQAYDSKEHFEWRYLIPDPKMLATVASVVSALFFPVMGLEQGAVDIESLWTAFSHSVGIGVSVSGLASIGVPAFHKIASKYFLNKGYYFQFKDGKIQNLRRIKKYKDLKSLILCSDLLQAQNFIKK